MSLTFNIADLHGRSDLLKLAFKEIDKKWNPTEDTVVLTGDYIDRGPDSKGVIETIMQLQSIFPDRIVALKGNHETFMLDAYLNKGIDFWVTFNGGLETYKSYNLKPGRPFPENHIRWVKDLPLYHDDGKRLYVHAGVDHTKSLEEQEEHTLVWKLYHSEPAKFSQLTTGNLDGLEDSLPYDINGDKGGYGIISERHVVHGHHQFKDGPKLFTNRSNFDTLAWWTGRLVIGVFDNDKTGGPIDIIEIKGLPYYKKEPLV